MVRTKVVVRSGLNLPVAVIASKVIAVPVTSLAFLFYHNFRYGAAETIEVGILMLRLITNTATAVTHSIIPAYSIHGSGNLFHKASTSGIWANDIAVAVARIRGATSIFAAILLFILDG
ncbi:hypothetical protein [Haloarcula pellucida]|uniref:Uncharacterized protein n=1 Tax=Haloarcula pellucida TaxID=1427151 RepID=A0A830GN32_9EURY|nr:hypothetical protein [Halomicroarcula pellucida]MBX0347927.1 hypothetical protein [Halomicroarcula pellucida]GGN96098.1 hypothetical protein GCM10009030_24000 [Halomicroarcula pellucida]